MTELDKEISTLRSGLKAVEMVSVCFFSNSPSRRCAGCRWHPACGVPAQTVTDLRENSNTEEAKADCVQPGSRVSCLGGRAHWRGLDQILFRDPHGVPVLLINDVCSLRSHGTSLLCSGSVYWADTWGYGPFSRRGVGTIQSPCRPGVAMAKSSQSREHHVCAAWSPPEKHGVGKGGFGRRVKVA